MAEAEALVLGERRRRGADQLLADESREVRLDREPHRIRRELRDRAAMEDLALDRATLHHNADVAVERVDARLQERVDRRRHGDLAVAACSRTIASISSTKSGLPADATVIASRRLGVERSVGGEMRP